MLLTKQQQPQTALNSPCKASPSTLSWNISNSKSHLLYISTRESTAPLSETQQSMYSHHLIRQIMHKSKKRSIPHDINRISDEVALYARPIKAMENQFKFDSIPSQNKMYSSDCYNKVKMIRQGLKDGQLNRSILIDKNDKDKAKTAKNRPLSAASRIDTKNPRVSVSGLVTYNFKTVNGRKSLGLSQLNHQQNMVDKLVAQSKRQYCASQRNNRILAKTSGKRFTKHHKNQQAIMKDFQNPTSAYLSDLTQYQQDNTLIYNQKAQKLNFIKQYMASEKVDFEQAFHIVNQIQLNSKTAPKPKSPQPQRDPNDQSLLSGRKNPIQRKPLFVRQFQFIQ